MELLRRAYRKTGADALETWTPSFEKLIFKKKYVTFFRVRNQT